MCWGEKLWSVLHPEEILLQEVVGGVNTGIQLIYTINVWCGAMEEVRKG